MLHWTTLHLQPINLWSLPNWGLKMDDFLDVDFCSAEIDSYEQVAIVKRAGMYSISFYVTDFSDSETRSFEINSKSEAKKVYELLGKLLGE